MKSDNTGPVGAAQSGTVPGPAAAEPDPSFDVSCLFCRIVAGRVPAAVVRETAETLSFRDINPQAPAHVLVIPKAHGYRNAAELARHNPRLAAALLAEGAEVARELGLTDHEVPGYRFVFNTDDAAGQTVYHVHLHVLGGDALGRFGSAPTA